MHVQAEYTPFQNPQHMQISSRRGPLANIMTLLSMVCRRAGQIFRLLGTAVPSSSNFFLNYVLTKVSNSSAAVHVWSALCTQAITV